MKNAGVDTGIFAWQKRMIRLFRFLLVRDRKLLTATLAAGGNNATAVSRVHAFAEAVLVLSAAVRRLEGPFHDEISVFVLKIGRQR